MTKNSKLRLAVLLAAFGNTLAFGQTTYKWTTFTGLAGGPGNADGTGSTARFNAPLGIAVGAQGNIYVADRGNYTVRKITASGVVTTIAGSPGKSGHDDGSGTNATFDFGNVPLIGMAVDIIDSVYVMDNGIIRRIGAAGDVTTYNTSGEPFSSPTGLALDSANRMFLADAGNDCIRVIDSTGVSTTYAGTPGKMGSTDGQAFTTALFSFPNGIAVGPNGTLFVADTYNTEVRTVTTSGDVATIAGNYDRSNGTFTDNVSGPNARFNDLFGIAVDGKGNAFVADPYNQRIRKISSAGQVTSLVTMTNGERLSAVTSTVDSNVDGTVYATAGDAILKVTPGGQVSILAGSQPNTGSTNATGTNARFSAPFGVALDSNGNIYIADTANNTIRLASPGGVVTTLAGDPTVNVNSPPSPNPDGTGSGAWFNGPKGVTVDSNNVIFVADTNNQIIRQVTQGGVVTTIAGSTGATGNNDNATGSLARFSSPSAIAAAGGGVLYVADSGNHTIRAVTTAGAVTTFAGSAGHSGTADGTSAARFNNPQGIAVDSNGNVFVADSGNHTIRKITSAGSVSTLAGSAGSSGSADGAGKTARFNTPTGLTIDSLGNLFVTDSGNHTIRKITPAGVVTTIGGMAGVSTAKDGTGTAAAFSNPNGIAVTSFGQLYVADTSNNRIALGSPPVAAIAVEQPAGTGLVNGTSTINFGTLAVQSGHAITITLRDNGDAALTSFGLTIDGANAADFSVTTPPPSSVLPGKSATFVVTFTPSALAARNAILHIASNDPHQSPFNVNLTGTGVAGIAFASALTQVNEEAGTVQIPIIRTGSTSGAVSVIVNSAPGTATAADYGVVSNVQVNFADGDTTKSVPVSITLDALNEPNETFTLTLSNPQGGVILGSPATTTIRIIDTNDTTKPTVTIASPAAAANVPEGPVTVSGTAADNKGVLKVQGSLNGSAFVDVPTIVAANGLTATYAGTIAPIPGLNTVAVKSIDTRNNESTVVTRSFNYIVKRPLVVNITGTGTVTKPFPGTDSTKQVGFTYTLVATPGKGQVFNGWTVNSTTGTGITPAMLELPSLTFVHQQGLVLTANFILNPFTNAIIGQFNGLTTPSTTVPPPNGTVTGNSTVGFVTSTVTGTGSFTGQLKLDGDTMPISGQFDNTGVARFGPGRATTVTLARLNKPWLEVALTLDMTGTTSKLTGSVIQHLRSAVIAQLSIDADRAFYSSSNKVASTLAGTASKPYTLVFKHRTTEPGLTAVDYPQGDGYATGTVKTDGTVSFAGKLADNASITVSMPLSKDNHWPLFAQLYGLKGSISGMIKLDLTPSDTDMAATTALNWFSPYQTTQWYSFGWPAGIQVDAIGSQYAGPPASVFPGLNAVDAMNGNATLTFSNGQLTAPLLKNINLSPTNVVSKAPTTDTSFTVTLAPSTGAISGTFNHTDGTKPAWQGVLFQKTGANKAGYGYFMTVAPKVLDFTGESGTVHFDHK